MRRALILTLAVGALSVLPSPAQAEPEIQWLVSNESCGIWPFEPECETTLWRSGPDGENPRLLGSGPRWVSNPDWTVDGSRVVFERNSKSASAPEYSGPAEEIYSSMADGSEQRALTPEDDSEDHRPRFSPDGEQIVWAQGGGANLMFNQGLPPRIKVMNADGSGAREVVNLPGLVGGPDWTSDGSRIAFNWTPEWKMLGDMVTHVVSTKLDGSDLRRLTADDVSSHDATFSPDGRWLAFYSGGETLVVRSLVSGRTHSFFLAGWPARWSPDSRSLIVEGSRDRLTNHVWKLDVTAASPDLQALPEPGTGASVEAEFIGSPVATPRGDSAAPVGLVGAEQEGEDAGLSPSSVRPLTRARRPARLKLAKRTDLRFLAADRTGLRRVDLRVVRRGRAGRWRRIRTIRGFKRIRRDLRTGRQRLQMRTRDIRGNKRTTSVAVSVARR